MAGTGKKPYASAAQFYLDSGLDLKKALTWADAALAERPAAFNLALLRARILAKQGDREGALAAANQAIALAQKAHNAETDEYVRLSQDFIRTLR